MRMTFRAALVTLMLIPAGAFAQDFDKGFAAYSAGDFAVALKEFRPLAEQGDALAQFYLGESYFNGRGVPQDFARAIEWYTKAAQQGQMEAQEVLGGIYFFGKGVPVDYGLAAKWYTGPAAAGKPYPAFLLGYLYDQGQVVGDRDLEIEPARS